MTSDLPASRTVAAFKLPMPLAGLSYIVDCIERVYGTGETMMEPDGDIIRINAPVAGFGPLKTEGIRPPAPEPSGNMLTRYEFNDGVVNVEIEDVQNIMLAISEMMMKWFTSFGGVNYVELKLANKDVEPEFVFTLQRREGKTPAEMRDEAEARAVTAEARVAELEAQLREREVVR